MSIQSTQGQTPYTQQDIKGAWYLIQQAQNITLLTHYKPDADGVSACAALSHALEIMGKDVNTVYPTELDMYIKRQPANITINMHTTNPDLLIACDTANYERLYYPDAYKTIPLINIDHHISNSIKGTYNFVNGAAASTCEELFFIMQQWNKDLIDEYVAQCLMIGILYDTQVFRTQATTPRTLNVTAKLLDYGISLYDLQQELLANKNPHIVKLWGRVLSSVSINPSGTAAWAQITQADLKEFNLSIDALIGFSNFISEISTIDVAIVFYETKPGVTKVSLRSKTTDVNALAMQFGGGGHKFAAGILFEKPIDQAVSLVTSKL